MGGPVIDFEPSVPPASALDDGDDRQYLARLGDRVREGRARRGMTRRILARDSGVSERYLAQLESGSGNISILLLRQIARALNVPLSELAGDEPGEAVEFSLLTQFLKRLPAAQLAAARTQLVRDFGNASSGRARRIALIGLRGAGKSTLGARLARELGVSFIELDLEVEREAGTSLSEIFLLYGQAGYRRYERRCLERVLERHDRAVIATGGSIVSEPGTYELLLSACFTIWLKAQPEEHMARVLAQGDTRPMAASDAAMDDLRRILSGRSLLYGQADVIVDTAGKALEKSLADLRNAVTA